MRRKLLCLGCSLAGVALVAAFSACSTKSPNNSQPHTGNQRPDGSMPDGSMPDGNMPDGSMPDGSMPDGSMPDGSMPDGSMPDGGGHPCDPNAVTSNYVLIDDMETTTNGPIEFMTGINAPLTPGYWYNSGASYTGDDGGVADTSNPPQMSFAFSTLPAPTTTLACAK